mmetsp:Transcript_2973/g.9085  ORF Transcript_2973/g.9085 Transcript_2973/m.9085 type:complete len:193 (+) Transcript_2973:118-696(+)
MSRYALLALVGAATALTPPRARTAAASRSGRISAASPQSRGLRVRGGGGVGKFVDLVQRTDGLIGVFFWCAPYVLAVVPVIGTYVQQIFDHMYIKEGELAYIRWEIIWILGSLANTIIIMGGGSPDAQLRSCAIVWAVTFTICVLKFAAEKSRGWIDMEHGKYVFAQLVHCAVAATLWYGVWYSRPLAAATA